MPPGAMSLKIQAVFLFFFSVKNVHFREHVMCLFVASKFNSEMQAMFCGRILPSLYSFSCGSDFC